jgi:hypothetical protein
LEKPQHVKVWGLGSGLDRNSGASSDLGSHTPFPKITGKVTSISHKGDLKYCLLLKNIKSKGTNNTF